MRWKMNVDQDLCLGFWMEEEEHCRVQSLKTTMALGPSRFTFWGWEGTFSFTPKIGTGVNCNSSDARSGRPCSTEAELSGSCFCFLSLCDKSAVYLDYIFYSLSLSISLSLPFSYLYFGSWNLAQYLLGLTRCSFSDWFLLADLLHLSRLAPLWCCHQCVNVYVPGWMELWPSSTLGFKTI